VIHLRFGARGPWAAVAAALALLAPACGPAQPAPARPAPQVVRLWPGAAPGTESWTGEEVEVDADLPGSGRVHIVTNVTVPTLTVFRPPAGKANGTAMLVVPGGAFRALAWDLDGIEPARWLAARGVTAFVLKYRVRPPGDTAPAGPETFDAFALRTQPARAVAIADAGRALRLIRRDAAAYGVRPDRVGVIGFSAGAMTAIGTALATDAAVRPNFAVAAYGAMPDARRPGADAPPLFIVAARDDPQAPSLKSAEIFERWTRAGRPAELHLYETGGHGFGFRPRGRPVDRWPQALEAWLQARALVGTGAPR